MSRGLKSGRLLIAVTFLILTPLTVSGQLPPQPDLKSDQNILNAWLRASGLDEDLEILKLRWAPSVGESVCAASEMKLELRFISREFDEIQEEKRFQEFLSAYQAKNLEALPEKLFYKFVQLSGVPRRNASLHFQVLATDYSVVWDEKKHELVMQRGIEKGTGIRVSAEILQPPPASKGNALNISVSQPSITSMRGLSESIQKVLDNRFKQENKNMKLEPPDLHFDTLEDNYLGVDVKGVKGEILRSEKYWEKIGMAFNIEPSTNGWKLNLVLNAWFAGGLGTRPPKEYVEDIEASHADDLRIYGRSLLGDIKNSLTN